MSYSKHLKCLFKKKTYEEKMVKILVFFMKK